VNPFLRMALPWIGGAAVVMVLGAGVVLYGAHREAAGVTKERARAEAAQRAITEAYQLEKDRADAQLRAAVLARQAVEAKNADLLVEVATAHERIAGLGGLLQQYRDRAAAARAVGRHDAAGPDWIGILGQCVGRVEGLTGRLAQVGRDAARWADQVNGLQSYIRGLRSVPTSNH
jgi:hypothetical protein